ncbi:MAG: hypothetical protein P4L40_00400 [Terracidiphilus sp.]|nr:hypothetical protein [Terracidiphilus sp.]
MIVIVLQIVAVSLVVLFLGWSRLRIWRRNRQSWEGMLARMNHGWNASALSEHFPWKEGLNASPDETWTRIGGVHGLWAMYRNAGIMLELADFAARHVGADPTLLETIRNDATQIRLTALQAITGWAFSQASDNVRLGAFHVASKYTGMAAHMTEFLQNNADVALPSFVAAM